MTKSLLYYFDGSVQDSSISIANALEIQQSCTKTLCYTSDWFNLNLLSFEYDLRFFCHVICLCSDQSSQNITCIFTLMLIPMLWHETVWWYLYKNECFWASEVSADDLVQRARPLAGILQSIPVISCLLGAKVLGIELSGFPVILGYHATQKYGDICDTDHLVMIHWAMMGYLCFRASCAY